MVMSGQLMVKPLANPTCLSSAARWVFDTKSARARCRRQGQAHPALAGTARDWLDDITTRELQESSKVRFKGPDFPYRSMLSSAASQPPLYTCFGSCKSNGGTLNDEGLPDPQSLDRYRWLPSIHSSHRPYWSGSNRPSFLTQLPCLW